MYLKLCILFLKANPEKVTTQYHRTSTMTLNIICSLKDLIHSINICFCYVFLFTVKQILETFVTVYRDVLVHVEQFSKAFFGTENIEQCYEKNGSPKMFTLKN